MKVRSLIGYPSYRNIGLQFDEDDWTAYKGTKALKGDTFGGHAHFPTHWGLVRITPQNTSAVLSHFGKSVADLVATADPSFAVLVLPSSTCVTFGVDLKAQRYVSAIQHAGCSIPVVAPFRWVKALPKASAGEGSRDPDVLAHHLRIQELPGVQRAIFVDDVMTSGGHLKAAARVARRAGIQPVAAVCFARTVWQRPESILSPIEEDLSI